MRQSVACRLRSASLGLLDAGHVLPFRRIIGAGMHEQHAVAHPHQRQLGQELDMLGVELAARPLNHFARFRVHGGTRLARGGGIMIALHRNGAARHVLHDRLHHPGRVGAVADEVAGKRVLVGALLLGVRQAGAERLPVGVQVGHQG
jgi:hypothetical protein